MLQRNLYYCVSNKIINEYLKMTNEREKDNDSKMKNYSIYLNYLKFMRKCSLSQ